MLYAQSPDWWAWQPSDDHAMELVLGQSLDLVEDEAPRDRRCRPIESVLLAARRAGVPLSSELRITLKRAIHLRQALRVIRQLDDVDLPDSDTDPLFAHQRVALAYRHRARASSFLVADAPGVGKTAVALYLLLKTFKSAKALIVCRNAAKWQWAREVQRWGKRWAVTPPLVVLDGTIPEQAALFKSVRHGGIVIAHWEALVNLGQLMVRREWDLAVMDEAHNMRNRKTERARVAFGLSARRRLALTGHPWLNSPEEIYSILRFLKPDEYSSFWRFFNQHIAAVPKPFGGYEVLGLRNRKLLKWELEPLMIRRTRERVFPSLPLLTRNVQHVTMTGRHQREYQKLKKDLFAELEALPGNVPRVLMIPSVLARITRLRQHAVDPGLLGSAVPSPKYPEVRELLNEIKKPTVIFTSFREAAERLAAYLGEQRVGLLHGKNRKHHENVKEQFHRGELDALIVVTQAGGESLNLGRYGYCIFLDMPWSTGAIEQAEGRVDRPIEGSGQMVPATSYFILTAGSYEERLATKIVKKGAIFASVFTARTLKELLR